MKIGFDAKRATQNFTGLGNYSRFVINNLVKFYPDNFYELFSPKPSVGKVDTEISKGNNVKIFVKEGFKLFWRTLGIVKDIKNENITLYHGLSNELPYKINKSGAKSIVTIHDLIFLRHPKFYPVIDRKIYNIKARYACKVADRIIAVSECTKRDIIEYYGTDPNKIDIVYQGCFSIFRNRADGSKKQQVIDKYNLPPKFLLSIGSIEERKNILLIVKALKSIPNIHFVAIGKQRKYAEKVKQYALEHGLEDRVHLLSNVALEDLPAILQLSEIFIYPSFYEGFGIPIIEALSSEVPVIAAKGSCLEEAGGPHSIYIDPHNEDELATEIDRVLNDNNLKEKMVQEGMEYVKRFSDQKCTDDLMEVYRRLSHQNS
ncbi:glycosyltransferase family 4 protein [Dysgonomonas sp. ZJ279]|uniref:glycosyltransferase family 4 protein n=1 Tax=Dysgonomonas sp. ZJ279 TaxID=2709796 RepID=UPI0013EB4777|nr:glycosyltransferase family 1 protein [Dysgonomonas sp. ZJ279]